MIKLNIGLLVEVVLSLLCFAFTNSNVTAQLWTFDIRGHVSNSGFYIVLVDQNEIRYIESQLCDDFGSVLPNMFGLQESFADCKISPLKRAPLLLQMKISFDAELSSDLGCPVIKLFLKHLLSTASPYQTGRYAFIGKIDIELEKNLRRSRRNLDDLIDENTGYGYDAPDLQLKKDTVSVLQMSMKVKRNLLDAKSQDYIQYALLDVLPATFGLKKAFISSNIKWSQGTLSAKLSYLREKLYFGDLGICFQQFRDIYLHYLHLNFPINVLFPIDNFKITYYETSMVVERPTHLHSLPSKVNVFVEGTLYRRGKKVTGCHSAYNDPKSMEHKEIKDSLCDNIQYAWTFIIEGPIVSCDIIHIQRHAIDSSHRFRISVTLNAVHLRHTGFDYRCSTFTTFLKHTLDMHKPIEENYHRSIDTTVQLHGQTCDVKKPAFLYTGHLIISGVASKDGEQITSSLFQKDYSHIVRQLMNTTIYNIPNALAPSTAIMGQDMVVKMSHDKESLIQLTINLEEAVLSKQGLDASCETYATIVRHFFQTKPSQGEYGFTNLQSIKYGRRLKTQPDVSYNGNPKEDIMKQRVVLPLPKFDQ